MFVVIEASDEGGYKVVSLADKAPRILGALNLQRRQFARR